MPSSPGSDSRTSRGATPSKFAVVTLGCKVNQYESQAIREMLLAAGLAETDPLAGADIVVVNSCAVTLHSSAESRKWISRIRRESPATRIVATGCSSEVDPNALARADTLVPQSDKYALLKALNIPSARPGPDSNIHTVIRSFQGRTRAFLRIQDGCSRRCSFCAVPLARGRSLSKPPARVVEEARTIADGGCPEIVLCGVDMGKYGRDLSPKVTLPDVLEPLLDLSRPTRFRISSIDVNDVSDRLLSLMASSDRVCPHLHLPLQSGDAGILRAMRRGYTPETFLERVCAVRDTYDRPAITTDCIVGFPGETDDCFENTLALVRHARFTRLHVFRFSARPGTDADTFPDRLPDRVVSERARVLIDAGLHLAADYRSALLAGPESAPPCTLDVVIERSRAARSSGLAGRYVRVLVTDPLPPGSQLKVVPTALDGTDVVGRLA